MDFDVYISEPIKKAFEYECKVQGIELVLQKTLTTEERQEPVVGFKPRNMFFYKAKTDRKNAPSLDRIAKICYEIYFDHNERPYTLF